MRYVYRITNLVNGKVYVGQTYNFAQRKAGHVYASKDANVEYPLYRSMRKHGVENFSFEIIEECVNELVDEREKFWISHYDSTNSSKGYNLAPGGRGFTDEGRRKFSEALKGNTHCVGRIASEETREKLRKCGSITVVRRFGKKETVTELRTCKCGSTFEVTYSPNRRSHSRTTCSNKCSHSRERTRKIRDKIAASLRKEHDPIVIRLIKEGAPLIQIMNDHGVSYTTLKRLKKVYSESR